MSKTIITRPFAVRFQGLFIPNPAPAKNSMIPPILMLYPVATIISIFFEINFLIRFLQCEKEYDSIFGIFYAIFTVLLIRDFFTNSKSKSCAAAVFDARTICAIEGGPQQSHRLLWDWIAVSQQKTTDYSMRILRS